MEPGSCKWCRPGTGSIGNPDDAAMPQVSMIEGAMTKAAFEKEKAQHKDDAIITYWYAFDLAQPPLAAFGIGWFLQ